MRELFDLELALAMRRVTLAMIDLDAEIGATGSECAERLARLNDDIEAWKRILNYPHADLDQSADTLHRDHRFD